MRLQDRCLPVASGRLTTRLGRAPDPDDGALESPGGTQPRLQGGAGAHVFVAAPEVVAVMDSAIGLELGTAAALVLGGAFFVASLTTFFAWGRREIGRGRKNLRPLFPTPPDAS